MPSRFRITWRGTGAESQFPADPAYPHGTSLDLTLGFKPSCWTPLAYPLRALALTWWNVGLVA
jgi:hypothetical protein